MVVGTGTVLQYQIHIPRHHSVSTTAYNEVWIQGVLALYKETVLNHLSGHLADCSMIQIHYVLVWCKLNMGDCVR